MDMDQFWHDVINQNAEALPAYFQPDARINWHCTNERFTVSEFIKANCEYPGAWAGEIERKYALEDLLVTVVRVYAKDRSSSFHVVSFIQLREGRIASVDEYWAEDGAAPQWRLDRHIGTAIHP